MAEKFTRWDASDHLKTEEDITAYFEACLDIGQRYRTFSGGFVPSVEY